MPPVKAKDAKSAEKVPKDNGTQPQAGKGIGKNARLSRGVSKASAIFELVGDPVRLNILLTLDGGERGVGELCTLLGQGQPTVSHHLALLRLIGLVFPHRQGKQNLYSLTKQGQQIADLSREIERTAHPRKHLAPTAVPIDPVLLYDVGGFVDDPEGWFHTPNAEFEGRKPVDLLGTPDEARLRNRIEGAKLGMFS